MKPNKTLSDLDALKLAGHAVLSRLDRGAPLDQAPYERRPADERIKILAPRVIVLQDKTTSGKPMKKPRTMTVRQVAYFPANAHGKNPSIPQGLTQCAKTGEVFYVWTHKTRAERGGVVTFPTMTYDHCPEEQAIIFKTQEQNAVTFSEIDGLLAEAQ